MQATQCCPVLFHRARGIFVKTKRVLALSLPRMGSLFNDESSVGISPIASNILPGLVRNVCIHGAPFVQRSFPFDRSVLFTLPFTYYEFELPRGDPRLIRCQLESPRF